MITGTEYLKNREFHRIQYWNAYISLQESRYSGDNLINRAIAAGDNFMNPVSDFDALTLYPVAQSRRTDDYTRGECRVDLIVGDLRCWAIDYKKVATWLDNNSQDTEFVPPNAWQPWHLIHNVSGSVYPVTLPVIVLRDASVNVINEMPTSCILINRSGQKGPDEAEWIKEWAGRGWDVCRAYYTREHFIPCKYDADARKAVFVIGLSDDPARNCIDRLCCGEFEMVSVEDAIAEISERKKLEIRESLIRFFESSKNRAENDYNSTYSNLLIKAQALVAANNRLKTANKIADAFYTVMSAHAMVDTVKAVNGGGIEVVTHEFEMYDPKERYHLICPPQTIKWEDGILTIYDSGERFNSHPHVSLGSPCWGDCSDPVMYQAEGDILSLFLYVLDTFLPSLNSNSWFSDPYERLHCVEYGGIMPTPYYNDDDEYEDDDYEEEDEQEYNEEDEDEN